MKYSGKVMRITGNEAIVMAKDYEIVRIKLRKKVKIGEEIQFYAEDIIVESFNNHVSLSEFEVDSQVEADREFHANNETSYEKKKQNKFFSVAAISASFLLVFIFAHFFAILNKKEYAYIDVDINPSFSFIVDSRGRIEGINLLNEDAAHFVEGLEIKKDSFKNGLELIINNYRGKLGSPEQETVVLVAANFSHKNSIKKNYEAKVKKLFDELKSLNETFGKEENIKIKAFIVDEEIRNKALENQISMGKYVIYQVAKSELDISLDTVREKSVRELLEVVNMYNEYATYALIEFDTPGGEFALEDLSEEALRLGQELEEPQEIPGIQHPQDMPQETTEIIQRPEEVKEEFQLTQEEKEQKETQKSGRQRTSSTQRTTEGLKTPAVTQNSRKDIKVPTATSDSSKDSKAPTVMPKSINGTKTPTVTQKSSKSFGVPTETQRKRENQNVPSATPKVNNLQKMPTYTPKITATPKATQQHKTPTYTPKIAQPQKTSTATQKTTQTQNTPTATPKLAQEQETPRATPQVTPQATPKEVHTPKAPEGTPKSMKWQGIPVVTPEPGQLPETAIPDLKEVPGKTPAQETVKKAIRVLEDWENGRENKWYGPNLSVSKDWAASGDYSLRSRVNVWNKSKIILFNICDLDFTGYNTLCVVVKEEKSKLFEGKIKARIFIRTGNNWEWFMSDYKNISTYKNTTLKLDLTEVPDLDDVKSIGIEFYVSSNEKGLVNLYTDYLYLE